MTLFRRLLWALTAVICVGQQQQQQQPSCEVLKESRRAVFGVWRPWPPRSTISRVTVVLVSWRRPNSLTWLLEQYTSYLLVSEIIVIHNRRDGGASLEKPYRHPKVVSIDNYHLFKTYGHAAGFKGCLLARNPWVVVVRDDILLSESGLQLLVGAKAEGVADCTYSFSFHKSGVADEEDKDKDKDKESAAVSAAMIVDQASPRLITLRWAARTMDVSLSRSSRDQAYSNNKHTSTGTEPA